MRHPVSERCHAAAVGVLAAVRRRRALPLLSRIEHFSDKCARNRAVFRQKLGIRQDNQAKNRRCIA